MLHQLTTPSSGYVYMDMEVRHLGVGSTSTGRVVGMLMDLDLILPWPQQVRARSLQGECHLPWRECRPKTLALTGNCCQSLELCKAYSPGFGIDFSQE